MSYVDHPVSANSGYTDMEIGAARRYRETHGDVIDSLRDSGHSPHVWTTVAHGYAGDPFVRAHMACANCSRTWRGRIVNRMFGLSPHRECRPS